MKKSTAIGSVLGLLLLLFGCSTIVNKFNEKLSQKEIVQSDLLPTPYQYKLSDDRPARKYGYSRKQIENFLSTMIPDYINRDDVFIHMKKGMPGNRQLIYYIKDKMPADDFKRKLEGLEVNKWFEDSVTVTCKGNFLPPDLNYVQTFFSVVNRIIGTEKFIVVPDTETANIVVAFLDTLPEDGMVDFLGATIRLKDNLRTFFYSVKNKVNIMSYQATPKATTGYFDVTKLSSSELKFIKKHRFVKVFITNIQNPKMRYKAIAHELLHAIGFSSHSPFVDSCLFPVSTPMVELKNRAFLSDLDISMIEILYRPEILPSMRYFEVKRLLHVLKKRYKTHRTETKVLLKSKRDQLKREKSRLLNHADGLVHMKIQYQRNIRELGQLIKAINDKKNAAQLLVSPSQQIQRAGKQIMFINKQIKSIDLQKQEALNRFRQIERQLMTIAAQLNKL